MGFRVTVCLDLERLQVFEEMDFDFATVRIIKTNYKLQLRR